MTSTAPCGTVLDGSQGPAPDDRGGAKGWRGSGTHPVSAPRILVVDDDEDVSEALVSTLAEEGYDVLTARHGADALGILRQGELPRLIVLDLTMPRMSGSEFHRRALDEFPSLREVPFLVISADVEGRAQARGLGATAFLRKPIRLMELLNTVEAELQRVGREG